ncbi:DHHC palmitoyltransferase-domain-containing protein [Aspergillus coremiiformis]|uniref:Palmitoyltransferase n=1 Tax=Aspergillus coremiiformis TaxID=138285 RepID=A0A5N6ZDF9_9EURO|nr:DHHC palmitoyltransferase-domain-containing protein [Aspergillus coremiiformis]
MATLAASPPSSPSWSKRRSRAWALRCERYCCVAASFFPLVFVYGLTTWAVYVEASIGLKPSRNSWVGLSTSIIGLALYISLNASYSVAVFTDPGSPLSINGRHEYSALPVTELPEYTSYTVNSTGGSRFCKKCQCPKPDRAHHCSTCKRCVLKMDHHCPWLATCVGLHNYKAFLLFLIYTSIFCWVDFAVASSWIWTEVLNDTRYMDTILPVNVVLLAILGGIIGLVLSGFTVWHLSLAVRNLTTIESLEKTRYVSPLQKALDRRRYENILGNNRNDDGHDDPDSLGHRLQDYGNQILDAHTNAFPGVTGPEEGEVFLPAHSQPSPRGFHHTPAQQALSRSYVELERQRERDRYQSYLDEEDNEKMPNAFDLGWRRNLLHLFGDRPLLWPIPVRTTSGDGWHWETSPKFLEAREKVRQKREQEVNEEQQHYRDIYRRNMNNSRSWLGTDATPSMWVPSQPADVYHETERPTTGVSMKTLAPMSPRPRPGDSDFEDVDETLDLLPSRNNRSRPSQKPSKRNEESDEWRDWD